MIEIILLIIIIIILFINLEYFQNDNFKLLTKNELQKVLIDDVDNYYSKFTKLDLKVRNVNSLEEYKTKIINACYECNYNDYDKILFNINKVNKFLKDYKIIGFDGNKAVNIKWKIGVIDGEIYENGLPHTRGDIIIIPKDIINNIKLKNILLHEKIHIYQKMYPNDIQQYLSNNGFTISRKKTDSNNNIRANPDIDEYIYKNNNNQEMMCIYNDNPKTILDVSYLPDNNIINEHPLEYMAYNIELKII
jgi:hypothetical protein